MEINHETPMTSNFGSWFRGSHIFIFIFIFSSKTLRLTKYSGKIPKKNYALFYVPLSIWTWISMIFLYSQWFSYCTLQPSSRACPRIQQTSCNCDENHLFNPRVRLISRVSPFFNVRFWVACAFLLLNQNMWL